MTQDKKPRPARRRARTSKGHFKADNPATPVNEAWEPVEIEGDLEKTIDYSVKPKVSGSSTAGKYNKKTKTRPTFGGVTSIQY